MKKKCYNCSKEIDTKKERYVNLKTLEKEVEKESIYFHITCWKIYFDKKVQERSMNLIKQSVPHVREMVKEIIGVN